MVLISIFSNNNYQLVLIKNLINFNSLSFFSVINLFFSFNFNNFPFFNNLTFTFFIKKILNLNYYKIIKKNIFIEKKKSKLFFNNNFFFFFNKIKKKNNYLFWQKKNNYLLIPTFFSKQYFRFYSFTYFPLIGILRNKIFSFNEKSNFFLFKNNDTVLKIKKKKNNFMNSKIIFIKNIINFYFYLNKNKNFDSNFSFQIPNEFLIKSKNKFSRKNNFSRNFLFLNNSNFSRTIRFKFNNFTDIIFSLENFYFPFYITWKKKILFFKNYKNKYFNKLPLNNQHVIFKKQNIKIFQKNNLRYFFEKKKNLLLFQNNFINYKQLFSFDLFNKTNVKLKKKSLFFFQKPYLYSYLLKNIKKKIKFSIFFLNYFFKFNKLNFFFINNFNFKNFKNLWSKKKKYKSYKIIFNRLQKNLLFSVKKNIFNDYRSFLIKKKIIIFRKNLNNLNKIFFPKSFDNFSLTFINKFSLIYWFTFSFFKSNDNKFFQYKNSFYSRLIKNKFNSLLNTDIYFFSKTNYYFFHKFNGFFYLQNVSLNFENDVNSFYFKKIIYSFLGKNDLQRYILKKYLKNFSIFNNDPLSVSSNEMLFLNNKIDYFKNFNNIISQTILNKNRYHFEKILNFTKNFDELSDEMNIRKIKFKPGYMTLWREARSVLNKVWNLNFRYQQRLTKYLLNYQKHIKHFHVLTEDFKLLNILIFSRIALDIDIATNFLKNGLIFVNGFLTINPSFQIFKNDFIQCIVTTKYFILYKTLMNFSLLKKIRLRHKSRSKLHSFQLDDNKQRSKSFSYWTINNKNILLDVPNFLEVDYFTLSIFCLFHNIYINTRNPYSFIDIRYGVLNLYNWKYIN